MAQVGRSGNRCVLGGRIAAQETLRYTPAGIAAFSFTLLHESEVEEAGQPWRVRCEIPCLCYGSVAQAIAQQPAGSPVVVRGFLAAQSLRWVDRLVVHVLAWRSAET